MQIRLYFVLDDKKDKIPGFSTSFIIGSDNNIYALYIDDPTKLNAFVNNNPGFVGSDNNFDVNSDVGKKFWNTNTELQNAGYSANEAYTRATALILQNAGVTLLKSDATNINFKKTDIKVEKDSNGNTIYYNIDCTN